MKNPSSLQVAQALLAIDAVRFSPQQPITFKSGIISPIYVDNRCLPFHPEQWRIVIEGFQSLISQRQLDFDVIAGVAVGGIPHSAALAYVLRKPSVFVRKEVKEHGKQQRVEGGGITDKRVLLIEDLVTTGGSSLSGISALREVGAVVTDCVMIVSYDVEEAKTGFDSAKVVMHPLTTFPVILEAAIGRYSLQDIEIIADWLDDPHGWAQRHGFAE